MTDVATSGASCSDRAGERGVLGASIHIPAVCAAPAGGETYDEDMRDDTSPFIGAVGGRRH